MEGTTDPINFTPLDTSEKHFQPMIGSLFTRLAAYILDFSLFFIPATFIWLFFQSDQVGDFLSNIFGIAFFSYLVICLKMWGKTFGKHIFGLKVIRENKNSIGWVRAFFRDVIGKTLSNILFLGYLYALTNKKRQTLYDLLTDTIVIQQTPLTKLQKILRFLIIIILPIILGLFIIIIFGSQSDKQHKTDFLERIRQKIVIVNVVEKSDKKELKDEAQKRLMFYQNEIKTACRKEYFIRNNCNIEDLSLKSLKEIDKNLEIAIQQLLEIQGSNLPPLTSP